MMETEIVKGVTRAVIVTGDLIETDDGQSVEGLDSALVDLWNIVNDDEGSHLETLTVKVTIEVVDVKTEHPSPPCRGWKPYKEYSVETPRPGMKK